MAPHGISVNAICPGQTNTPLWRQGFNEETRRQRLATGEAGQPDDLVGCLVFLCSDQSRPLTGDILIREFPMRWRS